MSTYFTQVHHSQLAGLHNNLHSQPVQHLIAQMSSLHHTLYTRLSDYRLNLYPNPETRTGVAIQSLTTPFQADALSIIYTRERSQAASVENLMGRDTAGVSEGVRTHHHPAIELRLSPDYLAVEFVLPPTAWYDQQNFIGKLTIKQHREDLYMLLRRIHSQNTSQDAMLGFWSGLTPNDSHIMLSQLPPKVLLYEYLDTFAAGRDWFRLGYWHPPESPPLQMDKVQNTVFEHIQALYQVYQFVTWTSDNNFHSFYTSTKPKP
jgi:hypothetical protein